jgi:aspartyl aminopeptidase
MACLIRTRFCLLAHPTRTFSTLPNRQRVLNGGTAIKTNDNQLQRYATDVVSGFFFHEISQRAGQKSQEFMVRNDCPCGTTIGPIISGAVGTRTVDVGVPSLSMHSIRETIGVADVESNHKVFLEFFSGYDDLYSKFTGF